MPESPSSGHASSTGSGPGEHSALRPGMLMRLSVPAAGELRDVAGAVGAKIAEMLGTGKGEAASIAAAVEGLGGTVAPPGGASAEITYEFHTSKGELVVHARCDGRSSETRHRLRA